MDGRHLLQITETGRFTYGVYGLDPATSVDKRNLPVLTIAGPTSVDVPLGGSVTLSGTWSVGTEKIQWRHDLVTVQEGGSTFVIRQASEADAGYYTISGTNAYGVGISVPVVVNVVTPPQAYPYAVARAVGKPVTIQAAGLLSANAAGVKFSGLPASVTALKGKVALDATGNIVYTAPSPDRGEPDWFTYQITDGKGNSATGRVTVLASPADGIAAGRLLLSFASDTCEVRLVGSAQQAYQLQAALDPAGPWSNIGTRLTSDSAGFVRWSVKSGGRQVFYRAVH